MLPTPLTRLKWWRVVLDEAQMVESGTAAAAQMALKLNTVHRHVGEDVGGGPGQTLQVGHIRSAS